MAWLKRAREAERQGLETATIWEQWREAQKKRRQRLVIRRIVPPKAIESAQEEAPRFRIMLVQRVELPLRERSEALAGRGIRERVLGLDRREAYLAESAVKTMCAHIGWGENLRENRVEQGGILLGHAAKDKQGVYAVVEAAVPGEGAKGNSVYLRLDEAVWLDMMRRAGLEHPDMQVVGWYHTHPGALGVFMSGTDRATQLRVFPEDWHFALVLNPQRKEWKAFAGSHAAECCAGWLA